MPEAMISVQEAREAILRVVRPLEAETVPLEEALGRYLAREVTAAAAAPSFDSSAMDGYAVRPGPAGRRLTVVDESRAGTPARRSPGEGTAVRISTGAAVPQGEVAVIRQEDVIAEQEAIVTAVAVSAGLNVRRAGEDMPAGAVVLEAGRRLDAVGLGAAVTAGATGVQAHRRPRVGILCTGDELREPGEKLLAGQIHNSNGPMLRALAAGCGAEVAAVRRVGDDRRATERQLDEALRHCDVLIACGGVSVGPHDHVKPALSQLGVVEHFWRVALQPGKPTWFGTRENRLVFALPGNPVSAAVTFTLFAMPALLALQGDARPLPAPRHAVLATSLRRNVQREQAVRVRLTQRGAELRAEPTGPQGSHLVSSLVEADALALIPAGEGEVAAGEEVRLEPAPGGDRGEWER